MKLLVVFLLACVQMHLCVTANSVVNITDQGQLDKLLDAAGDTKLVVIFFWGKYSYKSKFISPQVSSMASFEFSDVSFLKVDVDAMEDATIFYGISSVPTFILIKNHEKVAISVGSDVSSLRRRIQENK